MMLISRDEKRIAVSRAACMMSGLLRELVDSSSQAVEVPVQVNARVHVLEKVVAYREFGNTLF